MKALLSRIHAKLGDLWWYTILLFVAQRFGDVINMFVGLWIVPKYVPMEELGAVLPLTSVVSLIGIPLSIIAIPFLKFIAVFAEKKEYGKAKALIRDAFVGTAIFALVTILFAYFCLPFFFERLRIQNGSLTLLLIFSTVSGSVSSIAVSAMDGLKMYKITVWFQAISAPFRLALMLIFMPFRALSGYVVGQCASPIVYIGGSILALRRFLMSDIRPAPYLKEHGKEILSYAWPLVLSAIIGSVAGNMDTLVIRHRLSEFESAGYYMVTRFSEMSVWAGSAFIAFLFPMLAGKDGDDKLSKHLLCHSVAGTIVVGILVSIFLWFAGEKILMLRQDWAKYAVLTPQMTFLALNGMLGMVANCCVTVFTARGNLSFFLYYLPMIMVKSVVLYALTGYEFFQGLLPGSWLSAIAGLQPCRLSFVVGYLLLSQLVVDVVLLVNAFRRMR